MATTTTNTTSLITATLPGSPYSVCMARYYVRAALRDYDLGGFSAAAAAVTSELVTKAITHTDTTKVGLELTCLEGAAAVAIVVTDDSSRFPVLRTTTADSENGHGLQIVAALSARWGWRRQHPGKAVYAILAKEV
jgi:hypothetical protein